jgi:cation diffusion facilitator CzcD-associated flavoprotein CzcO
LPNNVIPVAIIGAGPYGLSLASYLRHAGVPHRIFGAAMRSWQMQMPSGMFLKSEGFASNLAQPDGEMSLREFCEESGHAYRDYGLPVPLQVFVQYGLAFQRHFVPDLEEVIVRKIQRHDNGFMLLLSTGERLHARQVVLATGIDDFRYVPPALANLPSRFCSHTGDHHDYGRFKGRKVCVVGAGASATDAAAALHAAGANVHLISRSKKLHWISPRTERPLFERWFLRDPLGGGRFGQGHFYAGMPYLFRYFPREARLRIARTYLGPRGGWPVRECIEHLPKALGVTLDRAEVDGRRVVLHLSAKDGQTQTVEADHVIAGTGYRVDTRRLSFLDQNLRAAIRTLEGAPVLSAHFESSVPGLYFTGVSALYNFGPLMRFVAGTQFASGRVASQIAKVARAPVRATSLPAGFDLLMPRTSRADER